MSDTSAIEKLTSAIHSDPGNADLLFLLGAEMAQQKDYVGAVEQYNAALAINPNLHTARLQLGLLLLTMADPERSLAVMEPLEALDDSQSFKRFKRGLQALAQDEFSLCIQELAEGIRLNTDNAALNIDMQMIVDRVKESVSSDDASGSEEDTQQPDRSTRTDFSLYKSVDD